MSSIWDDPDEWEDMPVIRPSTESSLLDDDDKRRYHFSPPSRAAASFEVTSSNSSAIAGGSAVGNATGKKLADFDKGGHEWREKQKLDEMDYTRLELDDDPEEDEISMRTQYLFNEDKGMTPLSQMQATKTLLTEGQRIAYVGLCKLAAREMVQTLAIASKGAKELEPAKESCQNWANKIMGRLYRHMEVDAAEQRMIEQLAEHGVTAEDLVPSLATTHVVDNPEYDPDAEQEFAERAAAKAVEDERRRVEDEARRKEEEVVAAAKAEEERKSAEEREAKELEERLQEQLRLEEEEREKGRVAREVERIERRAKVDPFGEGDDFPDSPGSPFSLKSPKNPSLNSPKSSSIKSPRSPTRSPTSPSAKFSKGNFDSFDFDDDGGGDIGGALDAPPTPKASESASTSFPTLGDYTAASSSTSLPPSDLPPSTPPRPSIALDTDVEPEQPETPRPPHISPLPSPNPGEHQPENFLNPLPSTLPGVSTTLTAADKTITLDIRWTILCDLFLSLIADSVYDARSRVLLCLIADKLGLEWMDVVRFERRLTEALEIQEGVQQKEHDEVLEGQRKKGKKQRYAMMGLAAVGGGLVIGLSAGLLAPVIGAGLGAALTTVGVTGTTSFLAGAGGAAIISSGATLTGSVIGGKAMAKRTKHVKTFEFQPLHNNKRVNFYITVPGFMSGPLDDVRLPFSTIDPVMGDVYSVLWEPEMMGDTGNALKILTSEVLTQVGQQVLAMTVMTALLSALQWPIMLTKLGYLIDNPWSNALDRARQAGAVLADILVKRHLGVRPVSLVGFSLGARVIFYALVELAKMNAFGVVQEVYLFGATLTASKKVWRQVRGVVSGRFVNAFALNDWVLGYLFRATTGGLQTVAGLRPIEHVPDLENIDVTHILVGHMSYRVLMPVLLDYVGFKTTADHFDEPEQDEEDAPEREVITKEEEARRLEKKERGRLGIFKKKKSNNATPTGSAPMSRNPSGEYDDLPPRESSENVSRLSASSSPNSSTNSLKLENGRPRNHSSLSVSSTVPSDDEDTKEEAPSEAASPPAGPSPEIGGESPAIPSGFDLDKLREEVSHLPRAVPQPVTRPTTPVAPTPSIPDRSASVPPPSMPIATDLSALDTTLDPRELLRRQWAGEKVPDVSQPAVPPPANAWGAPASDPFTAPSLRHQTSFTFADSTGGFSTRPASPPPTFTFGAADGSVGAWGAPSGEENDAPDAAGSFVWGKTNASTSSFKSSNPW